MALIKCPECGKDVSDTIASCIHCGFVLKKAEERTEQQVQPEIELQKDCNEIVDSTDNSSVTTEQKSSKFNFILCSIVAIVIFFIILVAMAHTPRTGSNINSTSTTTTVPAVEMDLKTINNDYENNQINARETHEGKRYKIIAKVNRVSEDYVNVSPLFISGEYSVYLYYNNSQGEFVRNISKDDIITFEGTLTTIHSGIHMEFNNVIFIKKAE